MPEIDSSHIKSAEYDHQRRVLTLEFQNGHKYRYPGVPAFHYEGLLKAHSAGKYFHSRINNTFRGVKV